jgi:hypothetical protein
MPPALPLESAPTCYKNRKDDPDLDLKVSQGTGVFSLHKGYSFAESYRYRTP